MVTCSLKEDSTECEIKDVEDSRREPSIDDSSSQKHSNENATIEQPSSVNENYEPPAPIDTERNLYHITNPHYNFVERDDKILMTIDVYIKSIEKESLSVDFKEKTVTVVFRTSDPVMVKKYPFLEEKHCYLSWVINLNGEIVPAQSTHNLKPSKVEIIICKAEKKPWGSLISTNSLEVASPGEVKMDTWLPIAPAKPTDPQPAENNSPKELIPEAVCRPKCLPLVEVGYTGLINMGNTCYMNSMIQCLANTTPLRDYFQNSEFQPEINRDNPLGYKGVLALNFAVLLRQLWSGKQHAIEPSRIKHLLGSRYHQFAGFAQHDAVEFLDNLLDGLHEDLNRVKDKPLTGPVESDGRPDAEVADEAWRVHKQRNDSIIVDLFSGQYRSSLVCPVCDKISVTFDPFQNLALPLPPSKVTLKVKLFYRDANIRPAMMTLRMDSTLKVRQLKAEIKRVAGLTSTDVRIVQVHEGLIRKTHSDELAIYTFDKLCAFEVLPSSPDVVEISITQRLLMPMNVPTRCSSCKNSGVKTLKRCTNCFNVAYCDQACQRTHWSAHKPNCRPKPSIIAHPFIISMLKSELTYRNLYDTMLAYSKFTVEVTSVSSNPVVGEGQESAENPPLFFIKPIDDQGQGIAGKERLEDQGDTPLELSPCLALDWRNNERSSVYCTLDFKEPQFEPLDLGSDVQTGQDVMLQECLEQFMQPEVLGHGEDWRCPNCKDFRQATKQLTLWRLPEILIVQLKRFSARRLENKVDRKVNFPLRNLDLLPYMSTSALDGNQSPSATYDLFAVVNHYGNLFHGHYTAYAQCLGPTDDAKPDIGWRCMNDERVNDISDDQVVTKAAYCLLYRRRKGAVNGDAMATNVSEPTTCSSAGSPSLLGGLGYSDPEEVD